MVMVTVTDDQAIFDVEGVDKLWALRSRLQIPLAHITNVEANHDQVGRWWHGLKIIGTDVPGLVGAGTFYSHGEIVFWTCTIRPKQSCCRSITSDTRS
jgi:hypothetical protein